MIESLIADSWLMATLGGDATLGAAAPGGVHADVAPEGVTTLAAPWVVWFQVSAMDSLAVGSGRIVTDLVYEVRVTGRNATYGQLRAAANRVDALIEGQMNLAVPGLGTVIDCRRIEPVRMMEADGAAVYRHLGGQYAIKVQAA